MMIRNLLLFGLCFVPFVAEGATDDSYHPSGMLGQMHEEWRYTVNGRVEGAAKGLIDRNQLYISAKEYLKRNKLKIVDDPKWNTHGVISILLDAKPNPSTPSGFLGYYFVCILIDKPVDCLRPDVRTGYSIWKASDFFYAATADELRSQLLSSVDQALEKVVAEYNEGIRQEAESKRIRRLMK